MAILCGLTSSHMNTNGLIGSTRFPAFQCVHFSLGTIFRTGENYSICTAFNKRHGFPLFFQSCSSYSVCLSQTLTAHVSHSLSTPGWLYHLCSVHSWLTKIQHVLEEKKVCCVGLHLIYSSLFPYLIHPSICHLGLLQLLKAQTGPSLWKQAVRRKPSQHDGMAGCTHRRSDGRTVNWGNIKLVCAVKLATGALLQK